SFARSCGDAGGSTYSFSHDIGTFMSELPQEGEVVFVEAADVRDPVLQHRDALDAHAEREAGVRLGVDAAVLEHPGMHHAAAHDLDPARPLAHGAALRAADEARDVDLGARFREGEEARAEAD